MKNCRYWQEKTAMMNPNGTLLSDGPSFAKGNIPEDGFPGRVISAQKGDIQQLSGCHCLGRGWSRPPRRSPETNRHERIVVRELW